MHLRGDAAARPSVQLQPAAVGGLGSQEHEYGGGQEMVGVLRRSTGAPKVSGTPADDL